MSTTARVGQAWTAGPWEWTAVEGGWDGVKDKGGMIICKLHFNNPENARLISAAPELAEALRALTDRLADIIDVSQTMDWKSCGALREMKAARAALKKAGALP